MIIMKFGGTSVEDPAALARLVAIAGRERARNPVVVVSAMGRTTNGLLECAALAAGGNLPAATVRLDGIAAAHLRAAEAICPGPAGRPLADNLDALFGAARLTLAALAGGARPELPLIDALAATGELASSSIVTGALRSAGLAAEWVDIRPMMVTGDDFTRAPVLIDVASARLRDGFGTLLAAHPGRIPVTQGFIGATFSGETTTIGRGGSDYSAALLGASLGAEEIQIWTDVDGVMTADPRIVPEAATIEVLSFAEAAELAYFGAKVLHPSTIHPAMAKEIPVRVLNSRRPGHPGTMIVRRAPPGAAAVRAIAMKRPITVLKVTSDRMLMAYGFLARLFEVFSRHETSIDMVTTSEVSVSMTLDDTRHLDAIMTELDTFGDVSVDGGQAIVCLVGDRLRTEPGLVARIFSAVRVHPVSMISHGASAINISFALPAEAAEDAVITLHREFFGAGAGAASAPPGPPAAATGPPTGSETAH